MLTYQTNRNDVDGERSTKALKGHGGFTKKQKKKEKKCKRKFISPNCAIRSPELCDALTVFPNRATCSLEL